MGKSFRSSKDFASFIGSKSFRRRPTLLKPGSDIRQSPTAGDPKVEGSFRVIESSSSERRLRMSKEEESSISKSSSEDCRVPLADVVADCVRRWFQETLKEAKAGDISMQVLVGQMFCSGYGVPVNAEKLLSLHEYLTIKMREEHGYPGHRGLVLRHGKLVISAQVIMLVIQILMILLGMLNKSSCA